MLTSVYYYNYYKPYIMGTRETNNYAPRRARIADKKEAPESLSGGRMYVLNKAVKDEIINYAHNVSYGVTNLRSSARHTSYDMENFNRYAHREGFEDAVDQLTEDLSNFARHYNEATDFMQNQEQSANLRTFSMEVTDNINYNKERLSMLGFSLTEDGHMRFDRQTVEEMTPERINVAIGENIKIFGDLTRHTENILTEPLIDHMKFKALNYHYNYKMGMMEADGFSLLEAGILVDKWV
jgi:hypothetical protein